MKLLRFYSLLLTYGGSITPLIFLLIFNSPYIFTQTHFVRLVALVALVPLVTIWIFDRTRRPPRNAVVIMFLLFVLQLFASAMLGINFERSFYGVWERFGGVFDWFCIYVYILLLISSLTSRAEWHVFLKFISLVGSGAAIFALAQIIPNSFLFSSGDRIFGTLGNPSFLASYLLLTVGVTLYVATCAKSLFTYVAYVGVILQVAALVLTGSRGALLGLLVAFVVCAVYGVRRALQNAELKKLFVPLFFGFVAAMAIGAGVDSGFRRIIYSSITDETIEARLANIPIAIAGLRSAPGTGLGEENYYVAFQRYFDRRLYKGPEHSSWFDRPHNEFLARLSLGGVIGFFVYVVLWAVFCIKYFSRKNNAQDPFLYIMGSFGVGYALYLLFSFHSVADTQMWAVYFALLVFTVQGRIHQNEHSVSLARMPIVVSVLVIIISIGAGIVALIKPVTANYVIRSVHGTGSLELRVAAYESVRDFSQESDRVIVERFGSTLMAQDYSAETAPYYFLFINRVRDFLARNPHDVRHWLLLSDLYARAVENDDNFARHALILEAAVAVAPQRPDPYFARGVLSYYRSQRALPSEMDALRNQAKRDFDIALKNSDIYHEARIWKYFIEGEDARDYAQLISYIHSSKEKFSAREWLVVHEVKSLGTDSELSGELQALLNSEFDD